jgi:hypothetical protein
MKSILDPTFWYVPSVSMDIRKTFARINRQQRAGGSSGLERGDETSRNVLAILPRRRVAPASTR